MNIQSVSSAPEYISNFINNNTQVLINIYNEGINQYNNGMLVFNCSEENNKMDVVFMNESMIYDKLMNKENYNEFIKQIPADKKVLYIKDNDINSIFLIYI